MMLAAVGICFRFFFIDSATTEIYTLSLHDALPTWIACSISPTCSCTRCVRAMLRRPASDRKSTRLNSSHLVISYAVFCLKEKNGKSQTLDAVEQDGT